jgi:hypothetical protein
LTQPNGRCKGYADARLNAVNFGSSAERVIHGIGMAIRVGWKSAAPSATVCVDMSLPRKTRGFGRGSPGSEFLFLLGQEKEPKEGRPRFRRNPEAADLERAAKELAPLKQLSPASGSPAQGRQPRLRQRGENRRMSLRSSSTHAAAPDHKLSHDNATANYSRAAFAE